MFVLYLNDMRSAHIEDRSPAAWAETREALERLIEAEKVDGYNDGRWGKSFRRGGPLEWFNGAIFFDGELGHGIRDVGTLEQAIENTVRSWKEFRATVPEAK